MTVSDAILDSWNTEVFPMPPLNATISPAIVTALNDLDAASNAAAAAADSATSKSAAALAAQHDADTAVANASTARQLESQKLTQLQSLLAQTYGPPAIA